MAIIAKEHAGEGIEPIAEGVHTAICTGIIDLGVQYNEKFGKSARKCRIMWELPDVTYEDQEGNERRKVTSQEYSLSLHEKSKLRQHLQAWRGKSFTAEELAGFDLKNVLGKGCQIQFIHETKGDKVYANIAAIMGLPKGLKVETDTELLYFDLEDKSCFELFDSVPEWMREKIKESETYKEMMAPAEEGEVAKEELPF